MKLVAVIGEWLPNHLPVKSLHSVIRSRNRNNKRGMNTYKTKPTVVPNQQLHASILMPVAQATDICSSCDTGTRSIES